MTGQRQQSAVVIVRSTLLIAALFQPLRGRIQRTIDRRFFRAKYDAAKTLAAFGATLRNETDLSSLAGGLVGVVDETLRPAHISPWLRASAPTEYASRTWILRSEQTPEKGRDV